jgi:tRNA (guanosine-2'-O-)-methyltransferase
MSSAIDALIDRLGPARVCEALIPCLSGDRRARIEAVLDARLASVTAVVEDVYDPHNAAAAIRSCEGLGVAALHVVAGQHPFEIASGVTRGCHRWMTLERWPSVAGCAGALRERGFTVHATLPGAAATVDDVDVARPIALVFGNEHAGLSADAIAACDGAVSIPMFGMTRSFNLSVSVALAMSRIAARRREAIGAPGDLAGDERARLRARWYARKVRGALAIVERSVSGGTQPAVAPEPQSRENPGRSRRSDDS